LQGGACRPGGRIGYWRLQRRSSVSPVYATIVVGGCWPDGNSRDRYRSMTTQEAVLSSRIEGTQATLGDVLRFEAGEEPKQESRKLDIQEINNYRAALRHAEKGLTKRPFNLNLLLELHSILLNSVRGRDKGRGQFRTVQNWIGKHGIPMEKASYIPPEPLRIMPLMDNWEKYYHMERPYPLVQLAIVHAQFEIIHPFVDEMVDWGEF